eukprot:XP_011673210.1 PREDICTED: proline-rich transmembrane protein 1-like [Strongylocentrotus purpuratus]
MASEYKQFINEGCDVEGGGYDNLPSYDESNAISGSAPPQNPYPPPNSSGYPMQQPSKSQQASQFPQQQPATAVPQPQVIQVPMEQNIVHANMETMPRDYFVSALFVTFCCCLPFGIVALIKSIEVQHRSAVGDYRGAAKASLEAERWCQIGFSFGCISLCVCVFVGVLFSTLGSSSGFY